MAEPNLLLVCITAFIAVILLLALLAGAIRALTVIFPEKTAEGPDAALLAAIHSAAAVAFPGRKVTRIEEIR